MSSSIPKTYAKKTLFIDRSLSNGLHKMQNMECSTYYAVNFLEVFFLYKSIPRAYNFSTISNDLPLRFYKNTHV